MRIIRDILKGLEKTQSESQESDIGDVGRNVGVNIGTNEEKLLLLLKQDRTLTSQIPGGTLGITERQVERRSANLKKEGLLVRPGASRNGFWAAVEKNL